MNNVEELMIFYRECLRELVLNLVDFKVEFGKTKTDGTKEII